MRIIRQYRLTKYDAVKSGEEKTIAKIAETLIAQARSWIGCRESDGSHRKIIDIYNSHRPLARGYAVKYTDAWCAAFVEEVAREVIAGRWGNGEQRKRKLMEAGYDYAAVQKRVNELLRRLCENHTVDSFAVYSGNRYLIIRTKFEEFLQQASEI